MASTLIQHIQALTNQGKDLSDQEHEELTHAIKQYLGECLQDIKQAAPIEDGTVKTAQLISACAAASFLVGFVCASSERERWEGKLQSMLVVAADAAMEPYLADALPSHAYPLRA